MRFRAMTRPRADFIVDHSKRPLLTWPVAAILVLIALAVAVSS